jgi:hypothetical protein
MNRNRITMAIAGALMLIGLAAAPAIEAAVSKREASIPVNLAPPQASGFSLPVKTWSAYQPVEGLTNGSSR